MQVESSVEKDVPTGRKVGGIHLEPMQGSWSAIIAGEEDGDAVL